MSVIRVVREVMGSLKFIVSRYKLEHDAPHLILTYNPISGPHNLTCVAYSVHLYPCHVVGRKEVDLPKLAALRFETCCACGSSMLVALDWPARF